MTRVRADTKRRWLYEVIFEHDTPEGKLFDIALLVAVLTSVFAVVLDSVPEIHERYGAPLIALEWILTALFSVEYVLRLYAAPRRLRYAASFWGVIDLVAILPTYASFFFPGAQSLLVVRVFRMLRTFRILKLGQYRTEADELREAVAASVPKIIVFLGAVLSVVVITGAAMHLVEGPEHGFNNIPESMYWAIVTLTTVGYGDMAPSTPLGRGIASFIMVLGYGVIAVPTGIVSAEMAVRSSRLIVQRCGQCDLADHDPDAAYCRGCGAPLDALAES